MSYKDVSDLLKAAAVNWVHDYAQSMGAALAFYTMFSIAPLLLIVISVAGLVFGEEAARSEIFNQLDGMLGTSGALVVQGAGQPARSVLASVFGFVLLFIGATSVFAELQDALDRIWRAPARAGKSGLWRLVRARLLSFGMILGIGATVFPAPSLNNHKVDEKLGTINIQKADFHGKANKITLYLLFGIKFISLTYR